MGFRKAADFFQVSKWKLYKTARKRGIYAEIKKHNQAHVSLNHLVEKSSNRGKFSLRSHETCFQALSKVPTNVQHFAELGVYKQIRKKLPPGDKELFPHLPRQSFQLVSITICNMYLISILCKKKGTVQNLILMFKAGLYMYAS